MVQQETAATLFIDKDSWVQRLHPFTKLTYIVVTGVAAYAGPSKWWYAGMLLIVNVALIAGGSLLKEAIVALWRIILPLLLFMIPIHGFLYPDNATVLVEMFGLPLYQEGLIFALVTLLRLAVVLMASLLFVFSTHPADLITAVSDAGKSPSLAYLLGSPLLLLASMRQRINTVQAAQRARGLRTGGNVFQRFFSLAPLVMPLVIGAIVEIEQRSIALEVRGFTSPSGKTSLRRVPDSTTQRLARWLMLLTAAALILFRLSW